MNIDASGQHYFIVGQEAFVANPDEPVSVIIVDVNRTANRAPEITAVNLRTRKIFMVRLICLIASSYLIEV
jgi:hypothetical protein